MSISARTPEGMNKELRDRIGRLQGAMEDGYRNDVRHWVAQVVSTVRQIELYYDQEGR